MAIPATNIALSTVNTNLGNAATAALSLDNDRVRSLASNSSASGSAFSVSSLASKSGTFIMLTNTSANFTAAPTSYGFYFSRQPQLANAFYSVSQNASNSNLEFTKYYLNSGIRSRTAFRGPGSATLNGFDLSATSSTTSNLFIGTNFFNAGLLRVGVTKLNSNMQFVAQCYVPGYNTGNYGKVVLDASENVYFGAFTPIGANSTEYILTALNSSLTTVRWTKYRANSPIYPQCTDGAGNLYATIVNSGDSGTQRVIKFNSSGTELFQTTTRPIGGGGGTPVCNCNSSGTFAVLSDTYPTACLSFYNSAGAFQWARSLGNTTAGGRGVVSVTGTGDVYCVCIGTNVSIYLFKFNSSGTLIWQRQLTGVIATGLIPNIFFAQGELSIVGGADGVLTVAFTFGYSDEYDPRYESGVLSVQTDGSGTGTYAVGGATFTYAASSLTVAAVGSTTNATIAISSISPAAPVAFTPVSATPGSLTVSTVNI